MSTLVHGHCDTRFAAVRAAFANNFSAHGDVGASVAVFVEGRPVVDLWGGHLDAARTRPWPADGIVNVWSLGKAMSALALLRVMERHGISAAEPVARYWPEFAAAGKESVALETLLSHGAGLPGVERPMPENAHFDWALMTGALAAQAPWWEPGTAHGYHTNTFGHLVGEVVRRVTGRRLADYFRDEIALPMGVDFHFGTRPDDEPRIAELVYSDPPEGFERRGPDIPEDIAPAEMDPLTRMRWAAYRNPAFERATINSPAWHAAEFPSTNPQANARGVASIFAALASVLAGGAHPCLPSTESLRDATTPRSSGEDLVVGRPTRFGLGFQLSFEDRMLGHSLNAFGHYGAGGHIGFADPDVPLGFAYHMNHQGYAWRDPRNIALIDAVYDSL